MTTELLVSLSTLGVALVTLFVAVVTLLQGRRATAVAWAKSVKVRVTQLKRNSDVE